jgi:excisionase family DNA binding protein
LHTAERASDTVKEQHLVAQRSVAEREALVQDLVGQGALPETLRGRLLRTREVALLFQVSERAVTDWARKGRIPSVRTPGGHRRYPAEQVWSLLSGERGEHPEG